jgi:Uma2 family endonuclease
MTTAVSQSQSEAQSATIYPSGDGKPVAETFDHLYALFVTLEVLRQYLSGQQATVLGNQFLYYAEGFPKLRVAPDVMVIFGVAPGGRDSFKVWEEGAVPAVIFEITSAGTRQQDEVSKYELYEGLGVTEYWQFDPKGEWIAEQLRGYRLVGDTYGPITDGVSRVLQLRLAPEGKLIGFYELATGQRLLMPEELRQRWLQAEQRAEQAAQRVERLAERLRSLGIDPDEV